MSERRPLGSTYRLQLAGLGFDGARQLVPYLSDLGIETLYVSPILAAAPGSTHGYDVIDPTRLDPALGTPAQFEELLGELDAHDMRLLVDIVPNHMACERANAWWWDVLRNGRTSRFASTFDIDWSRHVGRVLVPTLARPLAELLDSITYDLDGTDRVMEIGGQVFPLSPGTKTGSDLKAVLARQHYQPAYWRLSSHEGNYRRFFDIDGLIGVRVEDYEVFERTHGCIAHLARDERIAGWRVDHVDGLKDPGQYLDRLADASAGTRRTTPVILVEKILSRGERAPRTWSFDGTTGYEFGDLAGGLFVDGPGATSLADAGRAATGERRTYHDVCLEAKREVIANSFDAALERLARLAMTALNDLRPGHDLSWFDVRRAIGELTVHLDVYRTYFDDGPFESEDLARLRRARDAAGEALSGEARRALFLVAEMLATPGASTELSQRWQQFSTAVMAKGVEDTATYRYWGPLGHAEVGSSPEEASSSPSAFHDLARLRRRRPDSLNATSTHDSKRSEDARSRLYALSEVPDAWTSLVARWRRRYRSDALDGRAVDAHDEGAIYQSLLALWPVGAERLPRELTARVQRYALKAAREAKRQTSWSDHDDRYERALAAYVATLCRDPRFVAEMSGFLKLTGAAAATNSLAMVVLKCVAPGVPDFYQGTEIWDYSLTDPDNRRPVDFELRRRMLSRLPQSDLQAKERHDALGDLLAQWPSGAIKLFVTRELLALRRQYGTLFARGGYEAIESWGEQRDHVVAFARRRGRRWILAVVARHSIPVAGAQRFALARAWGATTLRLPEGAPKEFREVFSANSIEPVRGRLLVAECLADLPVAVLVGG